MASRVIKSYRLFVANLPWTVSPSELRNYFNKFGQIKNSKIVFNKNGWSRGYGFVTFNQEKDYRNVFNQKDHYLGGQMILVNPISKASTGQLNDFNELDNDASD